MLEELLEQIAMREDEDSLVDVGFFNQRAHESDDSVLDVRVRLHLRVVPVKTLGPALSLEAAHRLFHQQIVANDAFLVSVVRRNFRCLARWNILRKKKTLVFSNFILYIIYIISYLPMVILITYDNFDQRRKIVHNPTSDES